MLSGWNRRMRTWRSNPRQLPARLSIAERRALCFLVASAEARSAVIREKEGRPFPLPSTRNQFLVGGFAHSQRDGAPEGVQGASGKPPGRLRRGEILCDTGKGRQALSLAFYKESVSCGRFRPPAGGRGTFPHGKVPKGCRGRPKGACLMAAPGPPVAKLQCTASLAGARPARFTSVPGRATVAFGAADPSPGSPAPVYPWSDDKVPLR